VQIGDDHLRIGAFMHQNILNLHKSWLIRFSFLLISGQFIVTAFAFHSNKVNNKTVWDWLTAMIYNQPDWNDVLQ
jgi:hypothetical protein